MQTLHYNTTSLTHLRIHWDIERLRKFVTTLQKLSVDTDLESYDINLDFDELLACTVLTNIKFGPAYDPRSELTTNQSMTVIARFLEQLLPSMLHLSFSFPATRVRTVASHSHQISLLDWPMIATSLAPYLEITTVIINIDYDHPEGDEMWTGESMEYITQSLRQSTALHTSTEIMYSVDTEYEI